MDNKSTLIIFDTPGKNCPLNILTPRIGQLTNCKFGGGGCNFTQISPILGQSGGHLDQLNKDQTLFIVSKIKNRMKDSCSFSFKRRFYVLE